MSEPFLAEVRIFGFNFAPTGWAQCNGQLLPIAQNTALFSLLGTMYGGNGITNFGLPNLQNIAHLGEDGNNTPGTTGGSETVTLLSNQLPSHTHAVNCNTGPGNQYGPANDIWATDAAGINEYAPGPNGTMNQGAIVPNGSASPSPHNNMQPYLVLNYCIALNGIFPQRP